MNVTAVVAVCLGNNLTQSKVMLTALALLPNDDMTCT